MSRLGITVAALWAVLSAMALSAQAQGPAFVFGTDAGVVLTFVLPEKTEEFETVVNRFRDVLVASEDPIHRQQAEGWRIFRSPDPGPDGAVIYVSLMQPVLRGANYSIRHILTQELPEDEAMALTEQLAGTLSQQQSILSLEAVDLAE